MVYEEPGKVCGSAEKSSNDIIACREECSLLNSWDIIEPALKSRTPFCDLVKQGAALAPFTVAYKNDVYTILKI